MSDAARASFHGVTDLLPATSIAAEFARVCDETCRNCGKRAQAADRVRLYPSSMATRAVPTPLAQLPNALTAARLALIPVFVALVLTAEGGHSWPAAIVFGAAGVSDQLDGWLARRWRVESEFGKVADPLADRLMIDAAVILLVVADRLPWPALAVILARDAVLLGGYKLVASRGYELSVNFLGKLSTWLLYAAIAFVLVTHAGDDWPLWIFWTGLALAAGAGALYVQAAWKSTRR